MTALRVLLARVLGLLGARRRDRELDEEMAAHLEMAAADHERRGLSPDAARDAALRDFGSLVRARQIYRDRRGLPALDALAQDVRHAGRMIRRHPGFAAAAIATLALGIGATTAVFSLAYGVLLRPLPYPEPDRLVRVWEEHPGGTPIAAQRWLSNRTWHAWAPTAATLDAMGAYATLFQTTVLFDEGPGRVAGAVVSPSVFGMVGAVPALGRFFTPDEASGPEPQRLVVIGERLWRERFGARADVLGRSIVIDEVPHAIVGVASAALTFPNPQVRYWVPYLVPVADPEAGRTDVFTAIARLAPGATPAQAAAEGTSAARSVPRPLSTELMFGQGGPVVVHARRLADDVAAPVRPAMLAMLVAVALVLLAACANVANLFLSRGVARQRELAIRLAAGATSGRLAQQALAESLMLSLVAGAIGVLAAWVWVRVLPALAPSSFPRLDDVRIDGGVLAFTAAATITTALLAGLIPAVRSGRLDLAGAFRGGDGGTAGGFRSRAARRLRDGLLVVESGFAVVLLVGALLVGHSLARLMNVDPGYDASGVLTAVIEVPRSAPPERGALVADELLERLRALPGVVAAGVANTMPMNPMTAMTSFPVTARPGEGEPVMTRSVTYIVSPGYAEAVGLRLKAGRFFDARDQQPGVRAMLVNDEFARRYLAAPVVGRQLEDMYVNERGEGLITEIVGIVGNVLKDGHDRQPEPEIYFAHGSPTRRVGSYYTLAIRSAGDPAALGPVLTTIAAEIDGTVVVDRLERLDRLVSRSMAQPRFATVVLAAFAALGVALASVGLFAVLSYGVSQRRRELGVRAALGADRRGLIRLVLSEGLAVTALGLGLGLVAAAALTRLLEALLFGVGPLDPLSFMTAPAILIVVATLASLLPALRAASTDPAIAIRGD